MSKSLYHYVKLRYLFVDVTQTPLSFWSQECTIPPPSMYQPMDEGANMLKSRLRWPPPAVIKFSGNESYPLILKQAGFPQGEEMTYM